MIKAVVFNLDGTLLDTEGLNCVATGNILKKFGYDLPNYTAWYHENCAGIGIAKILEKIENAFAITINDKDNLIAGFREYRKDFFKDNPIPIKKGAVELLEFVKKQGLKMAICSGSHTEQIQLKTKTAGLSLDYFDVFVGGDMVGENQKPHPAPYLLTCEKLGVTPQDIIVIEDGNAGIESAHSAGCRIILVPDGVNSESAKEKAWKIVKSLDLVIPIIKELA